MLNRLRTVAIAAVAATTVAAVSPVAPPARAADPLTLREKVGQLVMFGVAGTRLDRDEVDAIVGAHLGAVILFRHNYTDRAQLRSLTKQIQASARRANSQSIGALVAVDQEGGVVKRFPDMPPWRSAPEMGAGRDFSLAYDQGRKTGRALHEVGVNVNLAPVVDLDLPPEHVMRSRSFGARRHRVGKMVAVFVGGMQRRGVAATLKHFPGLGGATINTDYGRSYVYRSKRELSAIDAVPFRYGIGRRARLVMVSHAMYVNDGGNKPASMSRYIATTRLRDELGFVGVAISDALEAVSWRFGGSLTKACAATVRAGVDIALITGSVFAARSCAGAIRAAVVSGDIPRARLDQAVARVLELKKWLDVYVPEDA